jgi:hypothetical protein
MSANTVDFFPMGKKVKVEERWKRRVMEEKKTGKGRRNRDGESGDKWFQMDILTKGRKIEPNST